MIYIVRGILEMETPLHCGEENAFGVLDAPVTRDAFGYWRIPGATVAGVLRSWVRTHKGAAVEESLFGQEKGAGGMGSLVWCSDAVLLDFDGRPAWQVRYEGGKPQIPVGSFVRDHVRIDIERGSAEAGGKFDEEYVPPGARFAFEISLDGWGETPSSELVLAFSGMIKAVEAGELHFGAHSATGFGSYKVRSLECRKFDLKDPVHMEQWLGLEDTPLFDANAGEDFSADGESAEEVSELISGSVEIPVKVAGPLLIAGGSPEGNIDADLCFVRTAAYDYERKELQERIVLPGSSIRGVVRHRVFQILKALCRNDAEQQLGDIFGTVSKEKTKRGKLSFSDSNLQKQGKNVSAADCCCTVQHVSIDRFTGGAMDAHLFNEAPLWKDEITFRLNARCSDLTPLQAGLLLHAFLDMAEGLLPVGNGVNRGNGRLTLDREAAIGFDLRWKGERITANDRTAARAWAWLSDISRAVQEDINAQAV